MLHIYHFTLKTLVICMSGTYDFHGKMNLNVCNTIKKAFIQQSYSMSGFQVSCYLKTPKLQWLTFVFKLSNVLVPKGHKAGGPQPN